MIVIFARAINEEKNKNKQQQKERNAPIYPIGHNSMLISDNIVRYFIDTIV